MDVIQEFETWSGIPVNTTKKKLMIIDGISTNRNVPVRVEYNNIPIDVTPETEAVRYLGFWGTPNGNMKTVMDLVMERTLRGKDLDRLDRYCRQGYKTEWNLNENVTNQPWTTSKNMGGMGWIMTFIG